MGDLAGGARVEADALRKIGLRVAGVRVFYALIRGQAIQ
jgi:hypothetical protein